MGRAVSVFLASLLVGALTLGLNVGVVSSGSSVYVYEVLYWIISGGGLKTNIVVESNSSVSDFYYNQSMREVGFKTAGPNNTAGFCNVTIPKSLLARPWTVLANGTETPFILGENETHSCLYLTYAHSLHEVRIMGSYTWAYELVNPNKAFAPSEKVYFVVRIANLPHSTSPIRVPPIGELRGLSVRNTNAIRGWARDFDWMHYPYSELPIGETWEGAQSHCAIREDPVWGNDSEIWGELGLDLYLWNVTPLGLGAGSFRLVLASPLPVDVRFDPDVLNVADENPLAALSIELPDGYDLTGIDLYTLQLNNTVRIVPAFPPEIGDFDNDSICEMRVTFDKDTCASRLAEIYGREESLISYIHSIPGVAHGAREYSNITFKVTGRLANDTFIDGIRIDEIPFEAYCSLKVIPTPGDVNCDGEVDIYDVVKACEAYDSTPSDKHWDPLCDIAEPYGVVDIYDVMVICDNYGEEYSP